MSVPEKKAKLQSIQTMMEASFQVSGPKLFNTLPKSLRDMTKCGPDEFKKELDKFLTFVPDEPKCPGLTPAAQNPVHYGETIEIAVSINCPDPQNV